MANYHALSHELQTKIERDRREHAVNPFYFCDDNVIRRKKDHEETNVWRPTFVRDSERILHNPYYNRYSDKTQVFSGYKNDDISRRALHVQLVARIARNIGSALGLNTDLIEAIALGHDIGHTPFGHAGERFLNELYNAHTGRLFNHNVQSVRVLDQLIPWNVSLQVLDGILCHNGEMELEEYRPRQLGSFEEFDQRVEACYTDPNANKQQIPSTLEGCVMRISDIIAYLGKDRQDAITLGLIDKNKTFSSGSIGITNSEIINNMIVNIIENSYGKDYICMEPEYFEAFSMAKKENAQIIYSNPEVDSFYSNIGPMFEEMYEKLLSSYEKDKDNSLVNRFHLQYLKQRNHGSDSFLEKYEKAGANQVVVDFIASMTDDYFVDLYRYMFPDSKRKIKYTGYFEQ